MKIEAVTMKANFGYGIDLSQVNVTRLNYEKDNIY